MLAGPFADATSWSERPQACPDITEPASVLAENGSLSTPAAAFAAAQYLIVPSAMPPS